MAKVVEKVKKTSSKAAKKQARAVESSDRYCLSGSGKVIKGKNSVFALGGDMTLKSRIIRNDINGKVSGMPPLTKAALLKAQEMWPHMFGPDGKPLGTLKVRTTPKVVSPGMPVHKKETDKSKKEKSVKADKPKKEKSVKADKPKKEKSVKADKPKKEKSVEADKPKKEKSVKADKPKKSKKDKKTHKPVPVVTSIFDDDNIDDEDDF